VYTILVPQRDHRLKRDDINSTRYHSTQAEIHIQLLLGPESIRKKPFTLSSSCRHFTVHPHTMDPLECTICLEKFTKENDRAPRFLQCGHSFCTACLQRIYKNGEVTCPTCRRVLTVTLFDEIPKNFALIAALPDSPNPASEAETSGMPICEVCQEAHEAQEAKFKCYECDKNICASSMRAHKFIPSMRTHTIAPIVPPDDAPPVGKCGKHGNDASYYDSACKELVCSTCRIADHGGHACIRATEAISEISKTLKTCRDKLRCRAQAINDEKERIRIQSDELTTRAQASASQISSVSRVLVAAVQEYEKKACARLREIVSTSLAQMESCDLKLTEAAGKVFSRLDEMAMLEVSPVALLRDGAKCHTAISSLCQEPVSDPLPAIPNLGVRDSKDFLVALNVGGFLKLQCDIEAYSRSQPSEGHVAIRDLANTTLVEEQPVMVTKNTPSARKPNDTVYEGASSSSSASSLATVDVPPPREFALLTSGFRGVNSKLFAMCVWYDLVYLVDFETRAVGVWSESGVLQRSFKLACPGSPKGIAFIWNRDIAEMLVIGTGLEYVAVMDLDGKNIRNFDRPDKGLSLASGICTNPMGTIVYVCDSGNDRIVVFSHTGAVLKTFNGNDPRCHALNHPKAIVFDNRSDLLYVLDSFGITMFSLNYANLGRFAENLYRQLDLPSSGGIALTPEGTMILTTKTYAVELIRGGREFRELKGAIDRRLDFSTARAVAASNKAIFVADIGRKMVFKFVRK
jgi:hypothetical protein